MVVMFMNRIKERLTILRREKGLSQADVGAWIGVDYRTISGYETQVSRPSIDALCVLAKKFEVSSDYLLGLTNDRRRTEFDGLPTQDVRVLKGFNNAPTHIKAAILTLLAPYEEGR
jgi:transcriptional regulator with XRE-family HTH domain